MTDPSVEILKQIRDEIRQTNARLEQTNARLDETRSDLSGRLEKLERRQTEMEMRLATELIAVAGAVNSLRDALLEDRRLRDTVADHEARLRVLEKRTG